MVKEWIILSSKIRNTKVKPYHSVQYCTKDSSQCNKARKGGKGMENRKEEVKLCRKLVKSIKAAKG